MPINWNIGTLFENPSFSETFQFNGVDYTGVVKRSSDGVLYEENGKLITADWDINCSVCQFDTEPKVNNKMTVRGVEYRIYSISTDSRGYRYTIKLLKPNQGK